MVFEIAPVPMTDLFAALEIGDVSAIREAARAGRNLNIQHREIGDSLLTLAIRHSTREFVEALLAAGCDPNFKKTCTSALGEAVTRGDKDLVQLLLDAGANVNAREEDGATPLMYAAAKGNIEIVKQLLAAGANPKAKDRHGTSALVSATEKGHMEICDILMPLSTSGERERANLIVELGAQSGSTDDADALVKSCVQRNEEYVRSAIAGGVAADVMQSDGTTTLMIAANRGLLSLVEFLVSCGACVNRKNVSGEWALSYAAIGGSSNTYDFLYPLTDKKLRKRPEKIKQVMIERGQWR